MKLCESKFMNHLTDYLFKVEDQLLVTLQKRLTQDDIVIVNAGLHFVDRPSKRLLGHSVQRFVDSYWALSGKAPMLWWRVVGCQLGGVPRVAVCWVQSVTAKPAIPLRGWGGGGGGEA